MAAVYQTIATSRLYEQIVEQIEKSILDGAIKPGDQLPPERELAQRFGVSRTAVREAVKALTEKGLVEALPGRGTFVTNSTSHTIRQSLDRMIRINQVDGVEHLIEVRAILEPAIAARAAAHADEKDLAALREAFAAMEQAGANADAYIEADLDFHLALAEAADNPLILALIDSIVVLLRQHRLRMFHVHGGPQRGQYHHTRILDAVARRDPDAARAAMTAHLQQVTEDSHKFQAVDPAPPKRPL
jgi:GntR family transcriptional repressor for pyruvate dehydrogenase complex